jgi:hypothetical protein
MKKIALILLCMLSPTLLCVSLAEDQHRPTEEKYIERDSLSTETDLADTTTNENDAVPTQEEVAAQTASTLENTTQGKRPWGSSSSHSLGSNDNDSAKQSNRDEANDADREENETKIPTHHIPFGSSKHGNSDTHYSSLEGFTLSGRIYIDPNDKLVHFDNHPQQISLPYWDCGASGATTSSIPLKNGYFRQALSPAPTSWSGTDGRHPILTIALSPLVIELNSGESQTFEAGDVILLEDVLLPGHRMRSVSGVLKVLYLTLPQDHYYTGKENVSLNFRKSTSDPCVDSLDAGKTKTEVYKTPSGSVIQNVWTPRRTRMAILGVISLSLSTLAVDFLGKTAPLWLAVGVGGTFFVIGSTVGLTVAGDALITAGEMRRERRKLNSATHTPFLVEDQLR